MFPVEKDIVENDFEKYLAEFYKIDQDNIIEVNLYDVIIIHRSNYEDLLERRELFETNICVKCQELNLKSKEGCPLDEIVTKIYFIGDLNKLIICWKGIISAFVTLDSDTFKLNNNTDIIQ